MVSLPVAAGVKPVPGDLPRRCRDRRGGAQVRPGGLAAEPFGVIPGGGQGQRGGVRAGAVQGEQSGRAGGDERDDQLVQAAELAVQELGAPAQLA